MNNLQRMIVISPEIFEKFKDIVLEDSNLSHLDKNMRSILHNKKLSDLNKWHLYRQNLIKYASTKRKNAHQNNFKWRPQVKHIEGVGVQTRRIFTKDKDTNTITPKVSLKHTQTNFLIPAYKSEGNLPTSDRGNEEEEVFVANSSNDDDDTDNNVDDNDDDVDNFIDKSQVRVKRESGGFETFEMKDGSVVSRPKKNKSFKDQGFFLKPKGKTDQSTLNFPVVKHSTSRTDRAVKRTNSERSQQKWTPI